VPKAVVDWPDVIELEEDKSGLGGGIWRLEARTAMQHEMRKCRKYIIFISIV
jgi:hypothetical protein